jgi:DNA (cytosine-5)-methyltransferase 1
MYTLVSLFSGAGGLDLGFVQTGLYRIVFANDILELAVIIFSQTGATIL